MTAPGNERLEGAEGAALFNDATIARFWSKVDRRNADKCWPWLGAAYTERGRTRGRFYALRRMFHAYQAAAIIAHGPCPSGMETLHSCDNPMCCNPAHLSWGTHTENMADCRARLRNPIHTKTHCKRGHPLSGDNLQHLTRGGRSCCICQVQRQRDSRQRMKSNG